MLKLVFWSLLAVNIVVFATALEYPDTSKTPTRIQSPDPVRPERIRIHPVFPNLPSGSESGKKEEPLTASCIEIGNFNTRDADIFEKKMGLSPDIVKRVTVNTADNYMVYIPASKNPKLAERKIARLKEKGISNYFFIPEGKFRHAISLGIFKTEESARKLVAELKTRGIHDVSIAGRGKITRNIAFRINDLDDRQFAQMNSLLETSPQITIKSCPQPD